MLSSGFGHSGPGDLHNGITAYSSITVFEYANLLMLVAVIPLPWLVPSWVSLWAICWQQGFSCWFLVSSCRWTPRCSATRKRGGAKSKERGMWNMETRNIFWKEAECLFPCYIPCRRWVGSLHPTLQQAFVLAVTVPHFCLPWLLPAWNLVSKRKSRDNNQRFSRRLPIRCPWWSAGSE